MTTKTGAANARQGFLLYLPRDLHRQLKKRAKVEQCSMTAIATEAIKRELCESRPEGWKIR